MMRIYSRIELGFLAEVYATTGIGLNDSQLAKMIQLVRDNATPDAAILSLSMQA